eukprot:CAMPEP_0198583276 /NCGR_PEP_ID=MMETSP1462-20131121/126552_1 /TAXON_ID=1333877 /ORGANISM="Brandtodinium nutriculum, Strain RCC3387" /LENGTH=294 /DNA_ID=CAMNT_0044314687 /DNA_START=232 /DNA_END=1113 /DNA_ORIENTATION=-
MSRGLWQVGLDHVYHSEDFGTFFYGPYRDKYHLKKKGLSWSELPKPIGPLAWRFPDREVMEKQSPEEFAAALSKCRIDAVAFDGFEELIQPVYQVSPGAKLVVLSWRPYEEWQKSINSYAPAVNLENALLPHVFAAQQALPWPMVDRWFAKLLNDRELERALKSGGPPITQALSPSRASLSGREGALARRRMTLLWAAGHHLHPSSKDQYDHFHSTVGDGVPQGDIMHWDMLKHTYEDLCDFLGISPCPKSGKIPKARNNFIFLQDFPLVAMYNVTSELVLHWVNYMILGAVIG